MRIRALILEDNPIDAELLVQELRRSGYEPEWRRVETESDYLAELCLAPDIIIADYTLPQFGALAALRLLKEAGLDVPFVIVTGTIGDERAVECIKEGATDYLLKDRLTRLGPAVARALAEKKLRDEKRLAEEELRRLKDRLQAENIYLQQEITQEHNFTDIVGQSAALRRVLDQVKQVAQTDATVLILGETGTGKELISRAIHDLSARRDRPLVKVNCTTLPAPLIESELFGHEKGAFTGATGQQIGRFELANGGTIFLDEIGDMPLELQAKLLRVLEEKVFERVGNPRTVAVDVRVIAATNRDLRKAVSDGGFRQDLYYRLNVFPISVPPLRERQEDIPLLAEHFLRKACRRLGKSNMSISQKTLRALQAYPWPGNVRELENIVERAVILARGSTLQVEGMLDEPDPSESRRAEAGAATLEETLESIERRRIQEALEQCKWRVAGKGGAAERLGMKPNTLRARMKKLGFQWR